MKLRFVLAALLLAPTLALAQTNVFISPQARSSVNTSSTITTTNTFQQVIPAPTEGGVYGQRMACTIQNNGTHTMYVFAGPIASATLTNSFQLASGSTYYCAAGVSVVSDQISITGTSGDAFYAAYQ